MAKTKLPTKTTTQNKDSPSLKDYLKKVGPGLVTGASDDDPSGIATYSIAGASLGYTQLWMALFTLPLVSSVQFTCAKIALVCKKGLAAVIKENYPRPVLYFAVTLLFIANTLNVGADLSAIAAAINLFVPIPPIVCIAALGFGIVALQIAGSYHTIAKVFKWLTLALFAYVATAFLANVDTTAMIKNTFIPNMKFNAEGISTVIAILGTTISPYLFFWQASQEVEEAKEKVKDKDSPNKSGAKNLASSEAETKQDIRFAAFDVNLGMFFSNTVMYFIILTCAATLHANGQTDIKSATDAAKALEPFAGQWAKLLFALGIIGTGLLAVPILTGSAAFALSEAFGWKSELNAPFKKAKQFYIVIILSTLAGVVLNLFKINVMDALFWSAVINGLAAPPILLIIMLIANNKKIMGKQTNGLLLNCLAGLTTVLMFAAAIALFATWGK